MSSLFVILRLKIALEALQDSQEMRIQNPQQCFLIEKRKRLEFFAYFGFSIVTSNQIFFNYRSIWAALRRFWVSSTPIYKLIGSGYSPDNRYSGQATKNQTEVRIYGWCEWKREILRLRSRLLGTRQLIFLKFGSTSLGFGWFHYTKPSVLLSYKLRIFSSPWFRVCLFLSKTAIGLFASKY